MTQSKEFVMCGHMMHLMPINPLSSMHHLTLMGDIAQFALRAVHLMICEVIVSVMFHGYPRCLLLQALPEWVPICEEPVKVPVCLSEWCCQHL